MERLTIGIMTGIVVYIILMLIEKKRIVTTNQLNNK